MSQCPRCHNEIQIQQNQFGSLFTCPHCQAVFFVDWSGQPEAPSTENYNDSFHDSPASSQNPSMEPSSFSQDQGSEPNISDTVFQELGALEDLPPLADASSEAPFQSSSFEHPQQGGVDSGQPHLENPFSAEEPEQDYNLNSSKEPMTLEGAMTEVLEFANSPTEKSLRSYQIEIYGLELEKDVQRLREVFKDPKFKFDAEAFIDGISHGKLKIADLNSIKAAILVRRLEMEHFEVKVTLES